MNNVQYTIQKKKKYLGNINIRFRKLEMICNEELEIF